MEIPGLEQVKSRLGMPSWQDVPFMAKEDLRSRSYDPTSRQDTLHWFSSSGSTAQPVLYPWTSADEEIARQTVEKVHPPSDYLKGEIAFVIAPTGLPGMWYHMNKQLQFIGLTTVFPGVGAHVLNLVEQLQPRLLMSLPLVLSRLGEPYNLRASGRSSLERELFSGGDVLSTSRRRRIEAMWGGRLRNFYGLSEVFGPVACESENPDSLIWQAEQVFVEILDPVTKQPVAEDQTGIAVITTLWERPASLVRYWTGDCFRLLKWLAPGRPLFQMRGRQQVSLPGLKPGVFPVDVDENLLADPASGNEWTVSDQGHEILLTVETAEGIDALDQKTGQQVQSLFDRPVRLKAATPGTLDRSTPKLGVTAVK